MSKLTVSPYTKQSVAQASGMRVTFDVTPPVEGVVYQNVYMAYYVGSDERNFEYAEAWRMTKTGKSGKRKRQRTLTLDHGGDDSFLGARRRLGGRLRHGHHHDNGVVRGGQHKILDAVKHHVQANRQSIHQTDSGSGLGYARHIRRHTAG